MTRWFQSTPAITGERALFERDSLRRHPKFQSTPAITGERAPQSAGPMTLRQLFQSTPAITGERAQGTLLVVPPSLEFQSTPAITGERAHRCRTRHCHQVVSIHARHYWRASLAWGRASAIRPDVSIHARHYWRASPDVIQAYGNPVLFQSTPAITGERAFRLWLQEQQDGCFNPRPPLLASEP